MCGQQLYSAAFLIHIWWESQSGYWRSSTLQGYISPDHRPTAKLVMLGDVAAGIMFTMASPGFFPCVTCVHCELALIYKESHATRKESVPGIHVAGLLLFLRTETSKIQSCSPDISFPLLRQCWEPKQTWSWTVSATWMVPPDSPSTDEDISKKQNWRKIGRWFNWSYTGFVSYCNDRVCFVVGLFFKQCITRSLLQSSFPCFYFEQQTVMPF